MVKFLYLPGKKKKQKQIVQSYMFQSHAIKIWWSGNEKSFCLLFTASRPLFYSEVNIFLNVIPWYSNKLTNKLFQTNYSLIYWQIKILFNTICWRLFGKFLHLRIFSITETRKRWEFHQYWFLYTFILDFLFSFFICTDFIPFM